NQIVTAILTVEIEVDGGRIVGIGGKSRIVRKKFDEGQTKLTACGRQRCLVANRKRQRIYDAVSLRMTDSGSRNRGRDRTKRIIRFPLLVGDALVVGKENPLVPKDRPADGSAKLVQQECRSRLRSGIVVVPRIKSRVSMEVVTRAVEIVRTRLDSNV